MNCHVERSAAGSEQEARAFERASDSVRERPSALEHLVKTVEYGQPERRVYLAQICVQPVSPNRGPPAGPAKVDQQTHFVCQVEAFSVTTSPPSLIAKGFVAWNEKTSASPCRPSLCPASSRLPKPEAESTRSGMSPAAHAASHR